MLLLGLSSTTVNATATQKIASNLVQTTSSMVNGASTPQQARYVSAAETQATSNSNFNRVAQNKLA